MRAVVRSVSRTLGRCELTHLERTPVDVELAHVQHELYAATLEKLGCELLRIPAEPELPDAVFVEDAALVLDEVAVITRPGAESRRRETESVARAIAPWRELRRIEAPATLDGGDVLRIGRTVYVGATPRSNAAGIAALREALAPFGYRVEAVPVRGCLHLKSAVTLAAPDTLLYNPRWIDRKRLPALRAIAVDGAEPHGANALAVGGAVVYPASCPRTARKLETLGLDVRRVDMSETEKAEGGVTCCSILFNGGPDAGR